MRIFVVASVVLGGLLLGGGGGAPALASPSVLEAWDSAVPGSATLALLGAGLLGLGLTPHRPRG